MLFAAALLLAPAAAQSGPALDTALLAAFDRHCATLDSYYAISSRVGAAWPEFTPKPGSHLAELVDYSKTAFTELPGFIYESRTFAPAGDDSLVAIVTRAGADEQFSLECRIVALEATTAPSAATITAWAKRKADTELNQDGVALWQWRPGLRPGQAVTAIGFIAPENTARTKLPLRGLTAQTSNRD